MMVKKLLDVNAVLVNSTQSASHPSVASDKQVYTEADLIRPVISVLTIPNLSSSTWTHIGSGAL